MSQVNSIKKSIKCYGPFRRQDGSDANVWVETWAQTKTHTLWHMLRRKLFSNIYVSTAQLIKRHTEVFQVH